MARTPTRTDRLTATQCRVLETLFDAELNRPWNPADIERASRDRVRRSSARSAAERLAGLGVLKPRRARAPRKGEDSKHFMLPTGLSGVFNAAIPYLRSMQHRSPDDWVWVATTFFLGSKYARTVLSVETVRELLADRGVITHRAFPIKDGTGRPGGPRKKRDHFEERAWLDLPVRKPDASIEQAAQIAVLKSAGTKKVPRPRLQALAEGHYASFEELNVIRPILALLEVSPSACLRFFGPWDPYFSPDHTSYSEDGLLSCIDHVLFRMIFDAINDVSISRQTPSGANATDVYVRPRPMIPTQQDSALLEITWGYQEYIAYDAGFDTVETVVFGGDEMEPEDLLALAADPSTEGFNRIWERKSMGSPLPPLNPENAWVRIRTGSISERLSAKRREGLAEAERRNE